MNAVTFDILAFSKRLQEAGVPAKQAEAHASAQTDFLTYHLLSEVATKTDLAELEAKLTVQIMKAATLQFVLLGGLMAIFKFIG